MIPSILKSFTYTVLSVDLFQFKLLLYMVATSVLVGCITVLYLYYKRMRKSHDFQSDELLNTRLERFTPEPLVDLNCVVVNKRQYIITGSVGTWIRINGKQCLNFGSHNYLNLTSQQDIVNEAIKTIRKYGVGSCGPRGFYGTVDVHLDLEERIAQFMKMEEAIVYSYGFSTVASAIPAYCKRDDVVFCDEKISFSARKGLEAARCTVYEFKHNDEKDLESKIQEFLVKQRGKKVMPRKFLILEGIYYNTGYICRLPEFVKLRKRYQMRLLLDESISIGVLGKYGRGTIEHYDLDPTDVDLVIGSLEYLIGSIGGFCVGSHFIIEHQRLSGLGYCFSASLPPVLTRAAYSAFDYLEQNSPEITEAVRSKSLELDTMLQNIGNVLLMGHPCAPIKYLRFLTPNGGVIREQVAYDSFVEKCFMKNLICCKFVGSKPNDIYIRFTVNVDFTAADFQLASKILKRTMADIYRICGLIP